jgi:hypothetical protein
MLLGRSGASLPRSLERMAGLQAQYAPSMYIGLWSRLQAFERGALERALERRTVVQGTLMRSTIHLVSRRDYWPLAVAVREGRREWWLRTHRDGPAHVSWPPRRGPCGGAWPGDRCGGPRSRSSSATLARRSSEESVTGSTWSGCRRRGHGSGAAPTSTRRPKIGSDRARCRRVEHLVRRYLGGFGPATRTEIAAWAGLPLRRIDPALERLRRFRSEDGEELLDLPRAPLPDGESPAPVRFLPVFDATLLVHARRTGILPEEHRPKVFNVRMPHSANTFLVDGAVAGTWRYERGRVRVEPFGRLHRAARRELGEEGERLAALYA